MKYVFTIIVLILSLNSSAFAQWDILNQGLKGFTSDADFFGNAGWIAGYTTLLKSEDNGLNWYEIDLGEDILIDKIDFVSLQMGWAYGFSGASGDNVIAITNDGGASWQPKHILETGYANDIFAMNEDTVFVLGGPTIIRTTDGFKTFTTTQVDIELAELRAIDFFDEKHGVIVGGSYGAEAASIILRTNDTGAKWGELTDQRIATISNVRFAGDSSAFFIAQDDSGNILFCKTTDFFNCWTVQKKTDGYANYVIYPVSEDTVYSVTTSFANTEHVLIEISYNAGINWHTLKELPFWGINNIHFEGNTGYVVGTVGGAGIIGQPYGPMVFRSTDKGRNWAMELFSYPFLDMFFLDESHGFACT